MDYCSTCRRHLNGALVCPGCGAYAPDIAPVTSGGRTVAARPVPSPTPESVPTAPPTPSLAPAQSVAPAQSAPPGRAARRRQLARWKKNQRRAVVATAVALVGGGLSAVALDRQGGERAQAASAPENPTVSGREEPTSEYTRPTTTGSDAHRSSSSATAPSRSTGRARGQDVPTDIRRDAAAAPETHPTAPSATAPRQTTTSSYDGTVTTPTGTTGTTGQQSSTSPTTSPTTSTTTDGTDTSASTSTSSTSSTSSSSQTGTSSASTSPSEVCLLGLVCLS
ncbi:SCO2400 family protein [Streptomyces griseoruber]|uniref:SCO2400 family protein n=2 Tax=Streptomyces griseoruber TaxID=1943 RepID=UPI000ABE50CF